MEKMDAKLNSGLQELVKGTIPEINQPSLDNKWKLS